MSYFDDLCKNNEKYIFNDEIYNDDIEFIIKYKDKLLDPNYRSDDEEFKDSFNQLRAIFISIISKIKYWTRELYFNIISYRCAKDSDVSNDTINERYDLFKSTVIDELRTYLIDNNDNYNEEFMKLLLDDINLNDSYELLKDILDEEDKSNFDMFTFPNIIIDDMVYDYLIQKYVYDYIPTHWTVVIDNVSKEPFKVFIAQMMNGLSLEEINLTRSKALEKIKETYKEKIGNREIIVLDTLNHKLPEGSHRLKYLGESIKLLPEADLVYFCKGWENAKGCIIEHEICKVYNIQYIFGDI